MNNDAKTERDAFLAAVAEQERCDAEWQERRAKMSPQEAADASWQIIMATFSK
jgi:hypothetical protein